MTGNQTAFSQGLLGSIADAMLDVGMCSAAVYVAPSESPVPCRVFITRSAGTLGGGAYYSAARHITDQASVTSGTVTLGLLHEDVAEPVRGAIVQADGDTFRLVACIDADEAVSKWTAEYV